MATQTPGENGLYSLRLGKKQQLQKSNRKNNASREGGGRGQNPGLLHLYLKRPVLTKNCKVYKETEKFDPQPGKKNKTKRAVNRNI